MILEFVKCVASLTVILVSGSLIYLSIIRKEDRRWLEAVAYGWGAGVVLLYIAAGLLIRVRALSFVWHFYYLGELDGSDRLSRHPCYAFDVFQSGRRCLC